MINKTHFSPLHTLFKDIREELATTGSSQSVETQTISQIFTSERFQKSKAFIENCPDLTKPDSGGYTPLALGNHWKRREVIDSSSDPTIEDPLIATHNRNQGFDDDSKPNEDLVTDINYAMHYGSAKELASLLSKYKTEDIKKTLNYIYPRGENNQGCTLFGLYINCCRDKQCKWLLKGSEAAKYRAEHGVLIEKIRLLLEYGANPNIPT